MQSAMSAVAGAFGVALIAAPCYAMAAGAPGTTTLASAGSAPTKLRATSDDTSIRPFRVNMPQTALDDLRKRVLATRWPDKETVDDQSQGVQLAKIRALVQYWGAEYDWRKVEAKLNSLPQFVTKLDGLDIHFIHVRSKHANALPLLITHGWPG